MRKFFLIACAALTLSSCLKVNDENLCGNTVAKPRLSVGAIDSVATGNPISVSVVNANNSFNYVWINPNGFKTGGSTLSGTLYGIYYVYATNGTCNSDTTSVNIVPSGGGCNLASGEFIWNGNQSSLQSLYVDDYSGYVMEFEDYYGNSFNVVFSSQPAAGSYSAISSGTLQTYQCEVSYVYNGINYRSVSGTVQVYYPDDYDLELTTCSVSMVQLGTSAPTYTAKFNVTEAL